LLEAMSDSPVVLLHGARQTGKSTLVQQVASQSHEARYLTFDDTAVLAAATGDPAGFLSGFDGPVVLDEIQRAPELFMAIKADVDRNRTPGRYLLTGSANVLMLPKLSESLAGRMEILPLCPLSQGEIANHREGFIDRLFSGKPIQAACPNTDELTLADRMLAGGYPEAYRRKRPARRRAWFNSYVSTILQRDVRDLANIEGLSALPRLLTLLAARVGSLLNHAEVSRSLGMVQTTLKRYMALLEATFLICPLPAWSGNLGKRLVKSPKLYLNDTALAAALIGQTHADGLRQLQLLGPMAENFVVTELRKQATWSQTEPSLYHFRTSAGREVDIVMESPSGDLVGIEVKTRATVNSNDFKGLRVLSQAVGKRFRHGVVLYSGREVVPFGKTLHAVPMASLWRV
jgi:predicted AAA+ superfamily ATPase